MSRRIKREPTLDSIAAAVRDLKMAVDKNIKALDIQFHRIAQIQSELDYIRKAWKEKGFSSYPDPRDQRSDEHDWMRGGASPAAKGRARSSRPERPRLS
jgi:hypothetical protein